MYNSDSVLRKKIVLLLLKLAEPYFIGRNSRKFSDYFLKKKTKNKKLIFCEMQKVRKCNLKKFYIYDY